MLHQVHPPRLNRSGGMNRNLELPRLIEYLSSRRLLKYSISRYFVFCQIVVKLKKVVSSAPNSSLVIFESVRPKLFSEK